MALRTGDGSSDPVVQAEPEEAQMPTASNRMSTASASTKSNAMLEVLGRRCSRLPFT